MTGAQEKFYWRLWSQLRKARGLANGDRHGEHERIGLPASHTDWDNGHFDRWKAHCMAAAQPGNLEAQIAQAQMPQTRKRVTLGHYLAALEKGEEHAEAIANSMNRAGRIGQPAPEDRAYVRDAAGERVEFDYADTRDGEPRRRGLTLDHLDDDELQKLIIAVKKECKRRWKTKADLLDAIYKFCREGFTRETRGEAAVYVCEKLGWSSWPRRGLDFLKYETLLCVFAALRGFVAGRTQPQEAECPF